MSDQNEKFPWPSAWEVICIVSGFSLFAAGIAWLTVTLAGH